MRAISRGMEAYIGRVEQQLSFVYVKDPASVAINALFSELSAVAFNISDGRSYGQYELANLSKRILNRKNMAATCAPRDDQSACFWYGAFTDGGERHLALNAEKLHELTAVNWHCSIDKAKAELGFYPRYSLEQGLRETLHWYCQQQLDIIIKIRIMKEQVLPAEGKIRQVSCSWVGRSCFYYDRRGYRNQQRLVQTESDRLHKQVISNWEVEQETVFPDQRFRSAG